MTFTPFACAVSTTFCIISCKRFYVYKVNQSCFCRILIQFYISFCLNGFLSAFFGCTECNRIRSLTKYLNEELSLSLPMFCKMRKYLHTSLHATQQHRLLCRFDSFCCCKDFFLSLPTIGTQIFGIPAPISIFTFTVFM